MNHLYVCAAAALFVASCGAPLKKTPENLQTPFQDTEYATEYFVEDEACQNASGQESIADETFYYELEQGSVTAKTFSAPNTTSSPSLRNPTIGRSLYNFGQVRDCRGEGGVDSCSAQARVTAATRAVKICSPRQFSRDSIEGITLTSVQHLSSAREFYLQQSGGNRDIAKADLLVLPKVETILDSGRRVETDNLAYAPTFAGGPAFVIFPKGKLADQLGFWKGYSLWELPWGLAHEYGHHVFRTHTGVTGKPVGTRLANGLFIETPFIGAPLHRSPVEPETKGFGLTAAAKGINDLWGATNEGFADLFAHYSLGEDSGLKNVDCFDESRNVSSPVFIDGTKKAITATVQFQFFSGAQSGGCDKPSFGDIHTLGAIIAHGVDRFLTAAEVLEKTPVLLAWAEELGAISGALSNSDDISVLVAPILKATKSRINTIPRKACDALEDVFPLHAEAMFRAEAEECL